MNDMANHEYEPVQLEEPTCDTHWEVESYRRVRQPTVEPAFKSLLPDFSETDQYLHEFARKIAATQAEESNPPENEDSAPYSFQEAVEMAISTKFASDRPRTQQTYRSFLNVFGEWITATPYPGLPLPNVSGEHVSEFLAWLQAEKKVGNTTYNNYLQRLTTAFNTLIKQGHLYANPCHTVESLTEEGGKNTPLNFHQRLTIEKYLQENNQPLFRFTRFLYFTFIRPGELVQLRIQDIDLKNQRIVVPASISKNRKAEPVTIPKQLQAELAPMRLDKHEPEAYVFSRNLLPGRAKIYPTHVGDLHRQVLRCCGIRQTDITLYSWRHTGVLNAYKAGIDLRTLQLHIRHQNMEMTNNYLERLGVAMRENIGQREW